MTNSWSLLYDTMYGPEEELQFNNSAQANSSHNDWWDQSFYRGEDSKDRISLADDLPISSMNNDMISIKKTENDDGSVQFDLNLDRSPHFWKYEEDKTLKDIRDYLSGTYQSHYTSKESKTQTLDLIDSIGDAEPFCRSNAIKYLSRFGKKNGKSKLDILKAIHYCILLYHFAGLHKKTSNNYETF